VLDVKAYSAWDEKAVASVIVPDLITRMLQLLDGFLEFVAQHEGSKLDQIIEALQKQWTALNAPRQAKEPPEVGRAASGTTWVRRNPELFKAFCLFVGSCFDTDETAGIRDQPTDILQTELCRAHHLPLYLMLKALVDVLGRATGIERMKQYIDGRIADRPKPASPPETLAELRARDIRWNTGDGGQNAISALVTAHQCLKKVTACRIQRALAPYGDADLMEVIACYPDYASIRRTNEHFSLTRTQTLMRGEPYCDTCFHDDRGGETPHHPSRNVFDDLESQL
jgi:hypothetical protein